MVLRDWLGKTYAVDGAFHIVHETATYTIADRTPPVISLRSPADRASYTLGQPVWVFFSCDDGPDGPLVVFGPALAGGPGWLGGVL